ncbi:MAG: hypothetical protein LKJ86_05705 [Oscillibacter sp.]|jgi:hypothetical protein|nr:hypothetical protein [Oscillibacter sp.]
MRNLMHKTHIKYLVLLLALWMGFCGLLTLSAAIPQSAVRNNMTTAAEYFRGRENLYELIEGEKATAVHDYSNAIWLNVAWHFDPDRPFSSAMEANYYQAEDDSQTDSFADSVMGGAQANTGYGRYWHGTAAILRMLLCVMPFQGAMILSGILLLALLGVYYLLLLRRRLYAVAIGSAAALVLCTLWVTPFCFEYAPCFLVVFAAADYTLWRYEKEKDFSAFFLVVGACICYFDFLTCEILTFALPMLLILCIDRPSNPAGIRATVKYGVFWLGGYGLSFLAKWLLAAAVSDESVRAVALSQGAFRMVGDLSWGENSILQRMDISIVTNLNFLFPMSLATKAGGVRLLFAGLLAVLFCLWFLFRKKPQIGLIPLYLLLLLPFARYVLLSNHSALHPFFTFRCLFISIVALSVIVSQTTDFRQFSKKRCKPEKRRRG